MFNFHTDHRNLVHTAFFVFLALTLLVAIVPAFLMQDTQPLPGMEPLTAEERRGLMIYNSENCVSCHTQQVRNIEMDQVWGTRPSIPSDYYYSKQRLDIWRQSPSLLGSERTGPDLTNIGLRQPGKEWHLLHMYNPRIVVEESIMPGYPWLFEEKYPDEIKEGDVVVSIPDIYLKNPMKKVVAKSELMDLIAYLHSLVQMDLGQVPAPSFIPAIAGKKIANNDPLGGEPRGMLDGALLYNNHCSACHQRNGEGIVGAFPSLAKSSIVQDADPELLIKIILQGYDARPEFSVMTAFADVLSDEEIAAIATYERSNWGHTASSITADQVRKIRDLVTKTSGSNQ